jgi:hypothetical protein
MTPAIRSTFGLSSISVPVTLALLLLAGVYVRGWLRLRSATQNPISGWQPAAFINGMLAHGLPWVRPYERFIMNCS